MSLVSKCKAISYAGDTRETQQKSIGGAVQSIEEIDAQQ
jgi:hypothetical protein